MVAQSKYKNKINEAFEDSSVCIQFNFYRVRDKEIFMSCSILNTTITKGTVFRENL